MDATACRVHSQFLHRQSFGLYKSGIGKPGRKMLTPFGPGPTTKIWNAPRLACQNRLAGLISRFAVTMVCHSFTKHIRISILFLFLYLPTLSQPGEKRIQYPGALKNSYFGVNIGSINYRFTAQHLENGFTAGAVQVPHPAVRLVLYGHQFNKWLSAQITYMRPVDWVKYRNINGDQKEHSVWMNVGGLTMLARVPLNKKFSISAEAGLGVITRKGFSISNTPVLKDAVYNSVLTGAALQYHLSSKWDLQLSGTWSPVNKKEKQPATFFVAAGFNYNLRPLSSGRVEENSRSGRYFPKQIIQAGYTTNSLGYGVNNAVSKGPVPVFWGGEVHLKQGFSVNYQRNIFHTKKVFAFDWGVGAGWWQTRVNNNKFITLSAYPVLRFMAMRTKTVNLFFEYSVAGPTYQSQPLLDNKETGRRFTFQDFMGVGVIAGKSRNLNAGIRIAHYSNGNIYPRNDGVKVPLSFNMGYVF
jgi:Lipid A 3-O-deacylase (PagL)/OmpA-like transmembrane domain